MSSCAGSEPNISVLLLGVSTSACTVLGLCDARLGPVRAVLGLCIVLADLVWAVLGLVSIEVRAIGKRLGLVAGPLDIGGGRAPGCRRSPLSATSTLKVRYLRYRGASEKYCGNTRANKGRMAGRQAHIMPTLTSTTDKVA